MFVTLVFIFIRDGYVVNTPCTLVGFDSQFFQNGHCLSKEIQYPFQAIQGVQVDKWNFNEDCHQCKFYESMDLWWSQSYFDFCQWHGFIMWKHETNEEWIPRINKNWDITIYFFLKTKISWPSFCNVCQGGGE